MSGLLPVTTASCLVALLSAAPPAVAPPPRPAGPPVVVNMTTTTRPPCLPGIYPGFVTAVDRESITVRGWNYNVGGNARSESYDPFTVTCTTTGWPVVLAGLDYDGSEGRWTGVRCVATREAITLTGWLGRRVVRRLADEPLRRFQVGLALEDGQWDPGVDGMWSYRLADIRVGDEVVLKINSYEPDAGEPLYNWCQAVAILRRPGGRIPPAPGEDPRWERRHHEQMQARQDWEERRAPYPYLYHPGGPIPQVAPPPREAKPEP